MKSLKLKKKNILIILVVISILLSKSLYFETFGDNILILTETSIILFFLTSYPIKELKNSKILFFLLIVFWIFINPNQVYTTSITLTFLMFNSMIISELIDINTYTKYFKKTIYFLCIASLFRYLFLITNVPGLPINFKSLVGVNYSNYIFFGIINEPTIFLNIIRNNGLWYEPGAFQIFINIAFLFGISFDEISKKEYFIFLITILTTLSSAGILIFFYLSIYYFIKKVSKGQFILLSIILIALILLFPINEIYFNKFSLQNASTSSRYNDLIFNIKSFIHYPILGTGLGETDLFQHLKKLYDYGTGSNTFGNILMYFGIGSILFYFPIFSNKIIVKRKNILKMVFPTSLLLIFFTQSFVLVHILWLIYFYQLNNIHVEIHNNYSS